MGADLHARSAVADPEDIVVGGHAGDDRVNRWCGRSVVLVDE